jgi:hypothetical protein
MQAQSVWTLRSITFSVLVLFALTPALAQDQTPLTQKDVIQLLQLKTPESEIIERLKKSGSIFVLGTEDEGRLKRAGASEAVIAAMKGGGQAGGIDAAAYEISDLALVIDYSGSMNARTKEGPSKMAAAKEAVGKLIDKLPGDLNVAVIVYGVSKQRGCEDIDLVQPLGPVSDRAALKAKLMRLANTGMTPIASSLELAGVALQKAKGGRAIVLVTDGVESCKGDPSAVASKLASEFGIKFGLHVIGFDIKADEKASLEQIAKNGHGKYFNADNATELASAMQRVTQQVATEVKQRTTSEYQASGQAIKGGAWFDDAPSVQAGEYKGDLRFREARYYQVPVSKGQTLTAIAIIKKTPLESNNPESAQIHQDFFVTIYSPSLAVGDRQAVKTVDNPQSPVSLRATWTAGHDGMAFVCVSTGANYFYVNEEGTLKTPPAPSPYTLKLRLEGEAGGTPPVAAKVLKVKGGSDFDSAGPIDGSGLVAGDLKYGESVYFSIASQKGDVLDVSMAAQKPVEKKSPMVGRAAHYDIVAYDDDQVQIAKKSFTIKENLPDAGSESLSVPVALAGKTYIAVSIRKLETDENPPPGRLAVLIKKQGESASSEISEMPAAAGSAENAAEAPATEKKPKSTDPFAGAESESASTPAEQSPAPDQ